MRRLFAITAFVSIAALGVAPAAHSLSLGLVPQRAILNVTGWQVRSAGDVAVPGPASGIGPGSYLLIHKPDGDFICTANFIWRSGSTSYLGAAGHCFLPETATATAGPGADYNPSATSVQVCVDLCLFGGQSGAVIQGDFVKLGPVAYARQIQGGVDVGNDFGIVQIPSSDSGLIRPSMPVWGGPKAATRLSLGQPVCLFGNGTGVAETFATMARFGFGLSEDASSWTAAIPASPGDSGSAVEACTPGLSGDGAIGILTHITGGGIAGTTVGKAISMATQANLSLSLVTG